jgi:hypothetical protein
MEDFQQCQVKILAVGCVQKGLEIASWLVLWWHCDSHLKWIQM